MRKYGLPYKGSKNQLAEWIVDLLPPADTLVDLFAGGCAITDCAMHTSKWKNFIINDIESDITQLFIDAISGKYKKEDRWISRESFHLLKNQDPYVRYCWSFGNNGREYLYSKEYEPYKKAMHRLMYASSGKERRLAYRGCLKELNNYLIVANSFKGSKGAIHSGLENLESLERLQSLERLESLQSLERLESFNLDFEEVPIPADTTIYCDIPYRNTDRYQKAGFDYERFYRWAIKQKNIFISEYWMPEDMFEVYAEKEHRTKMSPTNNKKTVEKIFVPRR